MRTPLYRSLVISMVLCVLVAGAATAQERPTITPDDYDKWESLGSPTFSPNGEWAAYSISRVGGENELRIHCLEPDTFKVVEYGSRANFSDDNRWLAYSIGYSEEERERMIADVFSAAEKEAEKFAAGKKYVDFVKKNVPKGEKLEVFGGSPAYKSAFPNMQLDKNLNGLVFRGENVEYNFTVARMMEAKKEELRNSVTKALFGE